MPTLNSDWSIGPEPVAPRLEDYGLSQAEIEKVPKRIFASKGTGRDPGMHQHAGAHGCWLAVVLDVVAFSAPYYFFGWHPSALLLFPIFSVLFVGIIYGALIPVVAQFEDEILARINPRYRKYREFRGADAEYRLAKYRRDSQIKERQEAIEREAERGRVKFWRSLSGVQFEKELAALFQRMGYEVESTPATNDQGVDLRLSKGGRLIVVQCKAHNRPVTPNVVRELYGSMIHFEADAAIIACFEGVTKSASDFLQGKEISVLTLSDIIDLHMRFGTTVASDLPR